MAETFRKVEGFELKADTYYCWVVNSKNQESSKMDRWLTLESLVNNTEKQFVQFCKAVFNQDGYGNS